MVTVHIPLYGPERMFGQAFALFQFLPVRSEPESHFTAFAIQLRLAFRLRYISYFFINSICSEVSLLNPAVP